MKFNTTLARRINIAEGIRRIKMLIPENITNVSELSLQTRLEIKRLEYVYNISESEHGIQFGVSTKVNKSGIEKGQNMQLVEEKNTEITLKNQENCLNCGTHFHNKTGRRKFCSDICRATHHNKNKF